MDQNTKDLICLCVCAINGTVPDHVDRMNLDGIYSIAERHLLSALISFPLRDAGVKGGRTASAIAKAERKAAILENV